jgi:serine/threonine protein kinase
MVLSPGDTLYRGCYSIIKLAGSGGMGYIYQARDTVRSRIVAIKEMKQQNLNRDELIKAQKRFQREADMLRKLSHSNLPRVYDSFSENGHSYLVMDFIEGKTLAELLVERSDKKLSINDVINYAIQLCDVLAYLHSRPHPIIFRDLKPANVMVTPKGDIYLIDFGIARFFKPGDLMDTELFGSLGFCPPEQLLGEGQTGVRSDLYSLGATLYFCLTGHNPRNNKPTVFNFTSVRDLNLQVPINLDNLILNLVATDEKKRPIDATAVLRHLNDIQLTAGNTTFDINGKANAMGSYYDAHRAKQALIQLQVKNDAK